MMSTGQGGDMDFILVLLLLAFTSKRNCYYLLSVCLFAMYFPCVLQNRPLTYEVSYSSQSSQQSRLIYHGLNNTVIFKLPAGDPTNNYSGKTVSFVGTLTYVCLIIQFLHAYIELGNLDRSFLS